VIVDLIGFGIVMPVLPFYAKELGASATTLGFLLTSHSAAQFVFSPVWGRLSDRLGRRPVLLFTVAGTATALLLLGLAKTLLGLFLARMLAGAFAANVSVASAYIADATPPQERTRWMGMLGASFGVGFLIGPAIGGALSPFGYRVPLLFAAGLAACNWLFAVASLREPARQTDGAESTDAPTRFALLREPAVRRLCLMNFTFSLAVTQLETVFAFFMLDRFGYDAQHVAMVLVGMALVMGTIQGGGMRALSARFEERTLVGAGALLLAVAFLAIPEASTVALLVVPLGVSAAGRAISQPALMSLVSLTATARQRGAVMGVFQSSASLARIVGPVVAGSLYDVRQALPFWLAGFLVLGVAAARGMLPARAATRQAGVEESKR
jgi:MFS family permease